MELTILGNWFSEELHWQKQMVSLRKILSSSRNTSASKREREVCRLWQTEGCETSFTISLRLHWLWNYNIRFHGLGCVFMVLSMLSVFETSLQLRGETWSCVSMPSTYTGFNSPSPLPSHINLASSDVQHKHLGRVVWHTSLGSCLT